MIDIETVSDRKLSQTLRLIKGEILRRGWKAELAYVGSSHCFIDRGDGKKLHIFNATPPTTSYPAGSMANDKYGTYELLKPAGLPQMETLFVDMMTPIEDRIAFMRRLGKIVVKPVDGAHGKGITVNVAEEKDLWKAIDVAYAMRKDVDGVLLQQQYLHGAIHDIRILCIDNKFIAATLRNPARVFGNGTQTIRELIDAENNTERRGRAYYAPLATIDTVLAETFLKERMNEIPADGQEVSVLGVANYGVGGETIDVTDDMPQWLKELAEKTAETCELAVAGIDFMLAEKPTTESTFDQLDPIITEVNKCPMLAMHDEPTVGESRGTVAKYVDYLATLA